MSRDFLRLQHLNAHYGNALAAQDISLNIDKGELVSLLGPSGCGKTTTLRMIAGFVQPTSGEVVIDGKDVTGLAPHRRNIGVVFQSYALFPHLTVLGNVAFGLSMRAVPKAERLERARAAAELVGLGKFVDRYPGQLSGGQQQRVALARALVIEPSVLLLDEPLSNLDAHLRGEMRSEIRALQQRLSITTVFVTHDQAEALAMSDRVVVMSAGKIVEVGDPRTLCDHPTHEFTASFLGERAVITGETHEGVFTAPGFRWDGAPAGATRAVLRAARLRFSPDAGPEVFAGTVVSSAYLGDAVETDVTTPSGRVRLLTPSDQPVPPVGSACRVHALPGSITFI
ncbi:iron(III) transport system ATP-binding protein [Ketogulonicigenium robustum]|uniref:Iron(III) transport system ATP-binding protein n=1 Tax=Ketogulonicigenium robustum TaxID=92947 RepID=A0A1W6NW55_9RHOB|nr:ABC transporter ATP-binding protein [Ketogulonicigenium robustum]ARO13439.1 iron(III) transport system ATP-binding protein [Ketogulonicigenium robustum]